MADFEVSAKVDTHGLERWSDAAMNGRMNAAMDEALSLGQTEVRKNTPVDQGIARGSIQTEHRGSGLDIRGRVYSAEEHVIVLEHGRRAGARPPPTAPIKAWLERHGIDGKLAFVVARSIGRRGTKPIKMFEQASGVLQRVVPGIFARHLR